MTMRPITAEDLLAFRLPGDPQISPDGTRIAYVETWIAKESNEYKSRIMMVAPGIKPVAFTSGDKDSNPRWSPDGRYLAFSRAGQLWLLPADGGEAHQLTKHKGCSGSAVWSPDSKRIAMTVRLGPGGVEPEKGDEEKDLFAKFTSGVKVIDNLAYKADGLGFPGDKANQVVLVEVESGEVRQLTGGPFAHSAPAWSPDGTQIALSAQRMADAEDKDFLYIWVVPANPETWPLPDEAYRKLTPDSLMASTPAWSPDGKRIAFAARSTGHGMPPDWRLCLTSPEGGEVRELTAGHDRPLFTLISTDMGPASTPLLAWAPDGRALLCTMSDGGSTYVAQVDAATAQVTYLTPPEQVVFSASLSVDGRRMALAVGEPHNPADVHLLADGDQRRLTESNAALLSELALANVQRFRFRAAPDAPEVDGWLVEPVNREPGKGYPAVLEIHGGPAMMYGCTFSFEFQFLATLGYAVLYTNPRGSVGYGRAFSNALAGFDWGNVDYADIMAGVDAALARFTWIDGGRLGVTGGSYGGYMTNWIVGHTDRFKAAITARSISNWNTMWGTGDISFNLLDELGHPWEDDAHWRRISPLTYVANIRTPLLIKHQEQDHRCPVEQAEQLYVALRKLRRPVKFVRYPDESHGMSRGGKPWHRVHRLKLFADWFGQYLQ